MKLCSLHLFARGKRQAKSDAHVIDMVGLMEPAEKAEDLATGRQNLRIVPRFEVDADAHLLLVAHGLTLPCRIIDLSLSGCRLRTRERFSARGTIRVEVSFKVRGLAFRFCGFTQWTDGRTLVGVRFVDISARRKDEFLEAIAEVEVDDAAKQAAEKEAAEEEAAAMRAAEEQAAAEFTAATTSAFGEQDERSTPQTPSLPVEEFASQALSGLRELSIPPSVCGLQIVRMTEAAETGLSGGLANPVAPEQVTASKPKSGEPSKPEARLGGPSLVRTNRRERRLQWREGVDTSAMIHLIHIASRLSGRILDLSLGGCRIQTDERFPVGIYTRVETEFHLEGLPFRLGGVIQAIHDRHHVGIRFLDMSSRKREQLEQLIEEIEELSRVWYRE